MGAPEQKVIARIVTSLDQATERLFRINAGTGWIGKILDRRSGTVVLGNPRPLRAAPPGWPDLFGWRTVTITPEMVGQKIAVARAVEVKAGGSDKNLSPDQRKFREVFAAMGGIFEVET